MGLCFSMNSFPQDKSQNYILSRTMIDDTGKYIESIQYYDGLGRPSVGIQKGITPLKSNLITLQEYDEAGRLLYSWLPCVSKKEFLTAIEFPAAAHTTYDDDQEPYEEFTYDSSPLNRLIAKAGAGERLKKPVVTRHLFNVATGNLCCKLYQVSSTGVLFQNGNYAEGELSITENIDENGNESYVFIDKLNRKILSRQMQKTVPHDTYFVYDSCDNLVLVLPPSYQDEPDLNLYAYQYKYDNWGHCIEKKLPGCQSIKYIYDQADNLIFSQDGAQREKLEWTFYLYDSFRRLTVKGICKNTNISLASEDIVVCSLAKSGGEIVASGIENSGYSSSFELSSPAVHQINYYDDYLNSATLL